ncbi:phosphopentomutase, partial [Eubacteriales bacterium OttesenSCG-928-M02]|nr:phosphopentomutase [Eubacteriales bacterium OttesenSCG-928-M02]
MFISPYMVGRVIARPFVGEKGSFIRTPGRRDYSIEPSDETVLDAISMGGFEVAAVGKIEDIFCQRGITKVNHTTSNM